MANSRICSVPDCSKPVYGFGRCYIHHYRWKKYGDPLAGHTFKGAVKRWVSEHLDYARDTCLIWPFARLKSGYGYLNTGNRKMMQANRYMCLQAHGEPPTPKHEAAHSCGQGHLGCVNPRHLRWATSLENKADMIEHGTWPVGSRNAMSKLTNAQVLEIRARAPHERYKIIAADYGIEPQRVSDIHCKRAWRHL